MKIQSIQNLVPLSFLSAVIFLSANVSSAQTPNAYGYSTGYGNVYGTFGLAQTMQTMYNTTRRNIQTTSSSSSTTSATQSSPHAAAPPARVVRNYGVLRPDSKVDTGQSVLGCPWRHSGGESAHSKDLRRNKAAYEKEAAPMGWNKNIAGGLTFFTIAAMTVYHDSEGPKTHLYDPKSWISSGAVPFSIYGPAQQWPLVAAAPPG